MLFWFPFRPHTMPAGPGIVTRHARLTFASGVLHVLASGPWGEGGIVTLSFCIPVHGNGDENRAEGDITYGWFRFRPWLVTIMLKNVGDCGRSSFGFWLLEVQVILRRNCWLLLCPKGVFGRLIVKVTKQSPPPLQHFCVIQRGPSADGPTGPQGTAASSTGGGPEGPRATRYTKSQSCFSDKDPTPTRKSKRCPIFVSWFCRGRGAFIQHQYGTLDTSASSPPSSALVSFTVISPLST